MQVGISKVCSQMEIELKVRLVISKRFVTIATVFFSLVLGLVTNSFAWSVGDIYPVYQDWGNNCSANGVVRVRQVTLNRLMNYGYNLSTDDDYIKNHFTTRCGFVFENIHEEIIASYNNGTMILKYILGDEIQLESIPQCEQGYKDIIDECGEVGNVKWNTWSWTTCNGECTCTSERQAKITDCSGVNNVDWSTWDGQTCTGGECKRVSNLQFGPSPTCPSQ